jgi:hypothetical protein
MEQNASEFAEVQARLPGRLDLGRDRMDWSNKVDLEIVAARRREPILVCRKVVCLWTPPKPVVNSESGPLCSPARGERLAAAVTSPERQPKPD